MNIKELFANAEDGKLSLEEFEKAAKEAGAKFTDLSEGKYVSKAKYDSDLKSKDDYIETITAEREQEKTTLNEQIEALNGNISTRDEDLAKLQEQLEKAGEDKTKLAELSDSLTNLQSKYDADIKGYQEKMQQQSYEFAVREFANTKNFTSNAAKRDFINSMLKKQLSMEDGKIAGREDFAEKYAEENADAFVVEKPQEPIVEPELIEPAEPAEPVEPAEPIPTFVGSTPGPEPSSSDGNFGFNFIGVRAH